jgi:ElaB/YqjD/DUF883 family membrane-anchored ribosome-binding protein
MNDSDKRDQQDQTSERLVQAYEQMLERTKEAVDQAQEATPKLRQMLEQVRDNMVELGELSREEGAKIADYVERDIADAAHWLVDTGEELKNWWRFDLELIEQRWLEAFTSVADQTSVQLKQWAERARDAALYQAGQITGPGTLVCDKCGAETHFTRSGRIPACAECGNLTFRRPQPASADKSAGKDDAAG